MIRIARLLAALVAAPLAVGLACWIWYFTDDWLWVVGPEPVLPFDTVARNAWNNWPIRQVVSIVAIAHVPFGIVTHVRGGGMVGWSALWGALVGAVSLFVYGSLAIHGHGNINALVVLGWGALVGMPCMVVASATFSWIDGVPWWRRPATSRTPSPHR